MPPSLHRRPWFPWMLVGLCVVMIVALGIQTIQGRHYAKETRRLLANTLWAETWHLTLILTNVERELRAGRVVAGQAGLHEAQVRADRLLHDAMTYQSLSDNADPMQELFLRYRTEPSRLEVALETASPPDVLPQVVILRTDLERWTAIFSEDLLTTGTHEQLRDAARQVCQDLRSPGEFQQRACESYR